MPAGECNLGGCIDEFDVCESGGADVRYGGDISFVDGAELSFEVRESLFKYEHPSDKGVRNDE